MSLVNFIKFELKNWGNLEKFIFPLLIILIIVLAIINKDNKISIIASTCGITYTILAGKGKISCYFIGIFGTLCYAYLAFKNGFYANCLLYALYYFPMEIIGILKWKNHIHKITKEVIKKRIGIKNFIKLIIIASIISILCALILKISKGKFPILDSCSTVFSILGMYLTVKRCIEQWYIWLFVNILTAIMWYYSYIRGEKILSILIMWIIYICLAIYFGYTWKKELAKNKYVYR